MRDSLRGRLSFQIISIKQIKNDSFKSINEQKLMTFVIRNLRLY